MTGAAGGLGRSLAVEAARRGWDLLLTDLPSSRLDELARALERSYGVRVATLFCDLTDTEARRELFRRVRALTPFLSGLVNVAGVDFEGAFEDLEPEAIQSIVRVNVEATLDLTRQALALRHKEQDFMLITVSSLAAFYPMPVKATYAASKRFLLDFFRALREELKHERVSVTVLCPAGLPTTPGAILGMERQGFWGRLTAVETGAAAAGTFDCALGGGFLYIPGLPNRMLRAASACFSPNFLAAVVARRWRNSRREAAGRKAAA